ncbi:MAG: hypothetical protein JNL97_16890, partial [Verrucomicrobiales bacterium]|nr:hypothetical protein [Verrucomicrobiales bacterium]
MMKTTQTLRRSLVVVFAILALPAARTEVLIATNRIVAAADASLDGEALVIDGATLTIAGGHRFAAVRLTRGGVLTHPPGAAGLNLRVAGDVTIEAGSAFALEGRGYPLEGDRGPGTGVRADWSGTGAGHGGTGGYSSTGVDGGVSYGSILEPTLLGSQGGDSNGGPGSAGGGALRLIVDGELKVEGRLTADGAAASANNAGGGSGGSLWLTVGRLTGSGAISANGGPGEWIDGGGGSGGRIAVYGNAEAFTGVVTAYGGGGSARGGAGTVYFEGGRDTVGDLRISNGADWGNVTRVDSPKPFRLHVGSRAVCHAEGPWILDRLEVGENGVVVQRSGQNRLEVRVAGDLEVAAGGTIHADGRGYPAGDERGPGSGTRREWGGSGGSHAGWGGVSATGA